MKFQDIFFLLVLVALFYKHNPKHFIIAGLLCLTASIPLFALWVFFTAQHLVWYAGGFLLVGILLKYWELMRFKAK